MAIPMFKYIAKQHQAAYGISINIAALEYLEVFTISAIIKIKSMASHMAANMYALIPKKIKHQKKLNSSCTTYKNMPML